MTGIRPLRDIEARHPALRGAKSPMQTFTDNRGRRASAGELFPVFAGVMCGVGGIGAVLAISDLDSPLRAPLTLLFLVVAPASAVAAALRGIDPLGRAVLAVAGAIAIDVLIAQAMLSLHLWSPRGGVVAVGVLSLLILLLGRARRRRVARKSQV
ncbi:hypothetical protein [Streptomyces sp. SAJ15]|uniref:hypothetical protein n=1 Tax=Streptomyces sp. SAJ15 TaxID=2011095 RepID=UPI0021B472FB|nr:hypothetical protein [Streptomyces sp. SAJ15]